MKIPNTVFIVPYRDRPRHLKKFIEYFEKNIRPRTDLGLIDVIISNQADTRNFNRGAMKNIGFLYLKRTYPEHYKDITCVFHDIDTIARDNVILNYTAEHGTLRHIYGFNYSLGGIFAIKCGDFEKTNGFPNHWGWGYEDNEFEYRCRKKGIKIDRSELINTGDTAKIARLDLIDSKLFVKYISPNEILRYIRRETDGIEDITNLKFNKVGPYFNVFMFNTMYKPESLVMYSQHLRDFMGNDVVRWVMKNYGDRKMSLVFE